MRAKFSLARMTNFQTLSRVLFRKETFIRSQQLLSCQSYDFRIVSYCIIFDKGVVGMGATI